MSRSQFHHLFYLLGAATVAISMPLSHFVMGLAIFLLLLNWLAEWNWQEKWNRMRENRQGLWFAAFYFVYAIGLVHVTDWTAAGEEMLGKLPFLLAPLIVITSQPFNSKELRFIFSAFVLSTLFCCIWNFAYTQTHTLHDFREMSRFIDHIRFSLCVVMSIVFCIHYVLHSEDINGVLRSIYWITIIILIPYLIYSQTLSGILILMVITLCYLIYLIANKTNKKTKWILGSLMAVFLLGTIGYTAYITYDYFHVKDSAPDKTTLTASGRSYTFDDQPMVENGHYIEHYICEEEMAIAWKMRSDTAYNELTAATLRRYLNSLGLRKDSAAVMSLSEEDIRHIENKTANIYYVRKGARRALYETFFGFSLYQKYGLMNESSVLQRVELWRASWQVIRENWLFGVGIGQQRAALDRQLELQHSPIAGKKQGRGSHNQFLSFWMAAGLIPLLYFCFLLVYPFVGMKKRITFVYFALILLLFLSMLVEDTLNAQTGRMLYTIFVPLLLFNKEANRKSNTIP